MSVPRGTPRVIQAMPIGPEERTLDERIIRWFDKPGVGSAVVVLALFGLAFADTLVDWIVGVAQAVLA